LKFVNTIIDEVLTTFRMRKLKDEEKKRNENVENNGKQEIHDLGDNFVKCIRDYEVFFLINQILKKDR